MSDEEQVKVIIAFDPFDREREGKTESLPAAEAHSLVNTGRARYADGEKAGKGSKKDATNNAANGS
jgi:hypothetical protein